MRIKWLAYWLRYIILWSLCTLLFFVIDGYLFFLLWIVLSILPFLSYLGMRIGARKIQITPKIQSNKPYLYYKSKLFAPLGSVEIAVSIHNLFYDSTVGITEVVLAHKSKEINLSYTSEGSGVLEIHVESYILRDMLGLFYRKVVVDEVCRVVQYPKLGEAVLQDLEHEGLEASVAWNSSIAGTDFELKEYQPSDSIKDIHHKMSYKMSKLLVKKYLPEKEVNWNIYVDLSASYEVCEEILSTLYAVAVYTIQNKETLHVAWDSGEERVEMSILQADDLRYCLDQILSSPKNARGLAEADRMQYGMIIEEKGMQFTQEVAYETNGTV